MQFQRGITFNFDELIIFAILYRLIIMIEEEKIKSLLLHFNTKVEHKTCGYTVLVYYTRHQTG